MEKSFEREEIDEVKGSCRFAYEQHYPTELGPRYKSRWRGKRGRRRLGMEYVGVFWRVMWDGNFDSI